MTSSWARRAGAAAAVIWAGAASGAGLPGKGAAPPAVSGPGAFPAPLLDAVNLLRGLQRLEPLTEQQVKLYGLIGPVGHQAAAVQAAQPFLESFYLEDGVPSVAGEKLDISAGDARRLHAMALQLLSGSEPGERAALAWVAERIAPPSPAPSGAELQAKLASLGVLAKGRARPATEGLKAALDGFFEGAQAAAPEVVGQPPIPAGAAQSLPEPAGPGAFPAPLLEAVNLLRGLLRLAPLTHKQVLLFELLGPTGRQAAAVQAAQRFLGSFRPEDGAVSVAGTRFAISAPVARRLEAMALGLLSEAEPDKRPGLLWAAERIAPPSPAPSSGALEAKLASLGVAVKVPARDAPAGLEAALDRYFEWARARRPRAPRKP